MKIEISGYELKIAIDEYFAKRGIDCNFGDGAYHEMSFSTTEYKREVKKHKNGKPVMQTINGISASIASRIESAAKGGGT